MAEESSGSSQMQQQQPDGQSITRRLRLGLRQMTHRSEEEGASSSVAAEHQDDDDEEAEDEEELPYPGFVKTAYYCMSQTTQPRKYCLRLVTWPYPFVFMDLSAKLTQRR